MKVQIIIKFNLEVEDNTNLKEMAEVCKKAFGKEISNCGAENLTLEVTKE